MLKANGVEVDRKTIIGGSDIAAIMGMSRWKTALGVWAEKTDRLHDELSNFEAAEIGGELEEYVAAKFQKKTGHRLRRDSRTFTHPDYPYMAAHIDRWVLAGDAIFEAKTCSAWKEKEWLGEEIPAEYVLQVNWYLGIVVKSIGYIAVLIGGQKFLWKEIRFDAALFQMQVQAAKTFWEEYVQKGIAPVAVASDAEILQKLFPQSHEKPVLRFEGDLELEVNQLIDTRAGGIEQIGIIQKEVDDAESKLKQMLGELETGETGQYRVTWKTQTRESADTAKLKSDGIFEQYKKVASFRALRVRKQGEKA